MWHVPQMIDYDVAIYLLGTCVFSDSNPRSSSLSPEEGWDTVT